MKGKKFVIFALFSVAAVSIILVGLFLFLAFFFNFFTEQNEGGVKGQERVYQMQELDFHSKRTTSGFVRLNRDIGRNEFTSYTSKNGNQVIISNFASSQFRCSASCVCPGTWRKSSRRFSTAINRSLFLLVSAFSSSVALQIAEKSFRSHCLSEVSSTDCDEEDVEIRSTSCEEEELEGPASFDCKGMCVKRFFPRDETPDAILRYQQEHSETEGCEESEGEMMQIVIDDTKGRTSEEVILEAKKKYADMHLNQFCEAVGRISLMVDGKEEDVRVCEGSQSDADTHGFGGYRNIFCPFSSANVWGKQKESEQTEE